MGLEFLYTVIDGARLPFFLQRGTYRNDNVIFAYHTDDLEGSMLEDAGREDIADHLHIYSPPALAIYDSDHFEGLDFHQDWAYQFQRPDRKLEALVTVALVTL